MGTGIFPAAAIADATGINRLAVAADGSLQVSPNAIPLNVLPATVVPANILSNSINVVNSAAATTVLTIPANRTWVGSLDIEICNTAGAAATFNSGSALVTGTNATPATGTKLLSAITHPGGSSAINGDANCPQTYITAPVGNSVTLQFQLDAAATTYSGWCSANGYLL